MSRGAAPAAKSKQPHEIWLHQIKFPDIEKPNDNVLTTYRTQQVGENSFQIDDGVLAILTQFLLAYARDDIIIKAGCPNIDKKIKSHLDEKIVPIPKKFLHTHISMIDWIRILNIATGFKPSNSLATLQQVAAIAASQSRPQLLQRAKPSLFPIIPIHPSQLIEAILHGDEKMVRDILNAVPELLLEEGTATDLLEKKFTGTPLQAAIAVNDVALNENSTDTVEIILEHLKRLEPDNYHILFEKQARELYEESLRAYVQKQKKEIARLCKLGGELPDNNPQQIEINKKIQQAQKIVRAYTNALSSKDLNIIFETHEQAQKDNAFGFKPYVDAILAIDINDPLQQAELDNVMALINAKTAEETKAVIERTGVAPRQTNDCRNKLFHELTLVQKLNRFREAFVLHAQQEIIFNPRHILGGLRLDYTTWGRLIPRHETDPNYYKRTVIFSQLVGWAQRNATEPVRQNIRCGIWYYLPEEWLKERIHFNHDFFLNHLIKSSPLDELLGYNHASLWSGEKAKWSGNYSNADLFIHLLLEYISSKNTKLRELIKHATTQPESRCVVQ